MIEQQIFMIFAGVFCGSFLFGTAANDCTAASRIEIL